jgi:flagellar biosynthesis protein FlhF
MQIRTYTAPTLAEALASVRAELGPEAYVLATDQPERGPARVVAALPDAAAPATPIGAEPETTSPGGDPPQEIPDDDEDPRARRQRGGRSPDDRPLPTSLAQIFARHGVPHPVADQLLRGSVAGGPLSMRLQAALAASFDFAPLVPARIEGPILLAGPAGGGKTVTAAKIIAAARLAGRDGHLITTDTWRAAGAEQLRRYAEALHVPCDEANSRKALRQMLALAESDAVVVVDTPGLDLMNRHDRQALLDWCDAIETSPTMVLPGGLDAEESAEIACAFAAIGGARLIATRLDSSRRLGNLLAAAHAGTLQFIAAGVAPRISGGLVTLDADMLARCLITDDRSPEALLDEPREDLPP